jgi:hypothetical protein
MDVRKCMVLPMTAFKIHALPYMLVDMSMSWAKRPNRGRRYRKVVADSGSFSVVGNLELVSGQHFLTRKHFMGNKMLRKLS